MRVRARTRVCRFE